MSLSKLAFKQLCMAVGGTAAVTVPVTHMATRRVLHHHAAAAPLPETTAMARAASAPARHRRGTQPPGPERIALADAGCASGGTGGSYRLAALGDFNPYVSAMDGLSTASDAGTTPAVIDGPFADGTFARGGSGAGFSGGSGGGSGGGGGEGGTPAGGDAPVTRASAGTGVAGGTSRPAAAARASTALPRLASAGATSGGGAAGTSATAGGIASVTNLTKPGDNGAGSGAGGSTGLQPTLARTDPSPVPGPATWSLVAAGSATVGIAVRHRRRTTPGVPPERVEMAGL